MALIVARNRVIICLLILMSILPATVNTVESAQPSAVLPNIASAVALAPPTGLIAIHGEGFSAGGLVYVAIYDRWGLDVHEHVWTVATTSTYGLNGSLDPALGYVAHGSIDEVVNLFPATVYGPNGSLDPALGYLPAEDVATGSELRCGRDLMVRAYDQQAASWSNLVDVSAAC